MAAGESRPKDVGDSQRARRNGHPVGDRHAGLGIPSEEDYVGAYCLRTGRDSMPGYNFYVAFNFFSLAAIFRGIKGRCALAWQQAVKAGA